MRPLLILLLSTALASPVAAQSIEMETLGEARAFAPGIDIPGGLSADGWIATRPDRAVRLMEELRTDTQHPVVRDMLRRVVLAGVAPPRDAGDDFARARIRAAQALATPSEYERFAARNPAAMDPVLRVDAALERSDLTAACAVSDSIVTDRGRSEWVRLRAACHEARNETAAAELARDILRSRGEATELEIGEAVDPFWAELWALDAAGLDSFLTDLARDPVADDLLAGEAPDPLSDPFAPPALETDYDINDALNDTTPRGTARLFVLGKAGDAKAVSAFVERAVAAGFDASATLTRIPALLDPAEMAAVDLPLFARHAVATDDLGMIRALFEVTENSVLQQRLALAADAMGGGFIARPLGDGLEEGLASGGPTATSNVLIALALGAELSETAEAALNDVEAGTVRSADWIAIDQAIDRGARAEALLRLAAQVPPADAATAEGWTLYRTIQGLSDAGFADIARQLAAYEFLRGL